MELTAYCNWLVIAITCWVSYLGFRYRGFEEKYIFWPEAILAWRQYYRLITSGFLHLNPWHLAMNMLSLYFFGPRLELVFGPVQFLGIYLAAIIGGNLLALYAHRHHDYRALGASGGVVGIIFAYIILFPGSRLSIGLVPIFVPSWLYAIAYLLASFYGMHTKMTNVGHDAHLGGALVGLFTAVALHPESIRYNPLLFTTISMGTILLYLYLAKNPMFLPLEGIDFTKPKARQRSRSTRPLFDRLFDWTRPRRRPSPTPSSRPDRQIDAILQRISEHGIDSLTEEEKRTLHEVSDKFRRRAVRKDPESGFPI
jgi:membrane associated rhomboid family serine protease